METLRTFAPAIGAIIIYLAYTRLKSGNWQSWWRCLASAAVGFVFLFIMLPTMGRVLKPHQTAASLKALAALGVIFVLVVSTAIQKIINIKALPLLALNLAAYVLYVLCWFQKYIR